MAKAMRPENFPLQGETFRSTDLRDGFRTIRLTSFATRLGYEWPNHYRYVIEANENNPARIGKTGRISGRTIAKHYKKTSH